MGPVEILVEIQNGEQAFARECVYQIEVLARVARGLVRAADRVHVEVAHRDDGVVVVKRNFSDKVRCLELLKV